MAVKSTAKLRYPEVLLPSSSFSRQETGKIEAIQSQEEAAAAPASTRYQARRMRRHYNIEGDFFAGNLTIVSPSLVPFSGYS